MNGRAAQVPPKGCAQQAKNDGSKRARVFVCVCVCVCVRRANESE